MVNIPNQQEPFHTEGPSNTPSLESAKKIKKTSVAGDAYLLPSPTLESEKIVLSDQGRPIVTTPDQPNLYPPDNLGDQTTGRTIQELKISPWFSRSFLAAFIAIMQEIANYERLNHLQESQIEITMRDYIFQLAKSNSELTKALYTEQAWEKTVDAVSKFLSASISATQFVLTTRNLGVATDRVDRKIDAKKQQIETKKYEEAGVLTPNNLQGGLVADTPQQIQQKLTAKEQTGYSEAVKKLEKELEKMESSRDFDIQQELRYEDEKTRHLSDTLKHTIDGVSQVVQAKIKLTEGEIDSLKQLTEGFLQAFNKYSETSSRSRDDAKTTFDRNYDFTNRMVESTFRSQLLSHAG